MRAEIINQGIPGVKKDEDCHAFKTGVADKKMFLDIIDANMQVLDYDYNIYGFNSKHLTFGLILTYYYLMYEKSIK